MKNYIYYVLVLISVCITLNHVQVSALESETDDEIFFLNTIPLIIDSSEIITDYLTDDYIVYKYTASEPCMLEVQITGDGVFLDIYVGNYLLASSDPSARTNRIKNGNKFCFNHTHGDCFFKVFGSGEYTLNIIRKNYCAKPVFFTKNTLNKSLYSELDILNPNISVLGNGEIETNYALYKNGALYISDKKELNVNSKVFTDVIFEPLNPVDTVFDESFSSNQNNFQYIVYDKTINQFNRTDSLIYNTNSSKVISLTYDINKPNFDDISVECNEDSVEINVIGASDSVGLAQRPFRYRIYAEGSNPPQYTDWVTTPYYNKSGLLNAGNYVAEVQIRDMIAERYQGSDMDLSEHILTQKSEFEVK